MSKTLCFGLLTYSVSALIPRVTVINQPVVQVVTKDIPTTMYNSTAVNVTTNAIVSCPSGYRAIDAFTCEAVQYAASTMSCPSGRTLTAGLCVGVDQQTPEFMCSAGFTKQGTKCVKSLVQTPSVACPDGYSFLDQNTCQKQTISSKVLSCPDGYYLVGNFCVGGGKSGSISGEYACTNGSLPTADGACLTFIKTTPVVSCPSGYAINSQSLCEGTQTANTIGFCNSGFTLVLNGVCQKNVSEAPIYKCPTGYTILATGGSTSSTSGDVCAASYQTGVRAECPTGFTLDSYKFMYDPSGSDACTKVALSVSLPTSTLGATAPTDTYGDTNTTQPNVVYNYIYEPQQSQIVAQPIIVKQKRFNLRI